MSLKQFLFILILIIVLAGAGGFIYYTYFLNTGSVDPLTGEGGGDRNLFPFGDSSNTSDPQTDASNGTGLGNNTTDSSTTVLDSTFSFGQLSQTPVSGSLVIKKDDVYYLRFIERASGHIFDINTINLSSERVLNNTATKIQESTFMNGGEIFLSQTLNDFGTASVFKNIINGVDLETSFVVRGLVSLDVSPDTSKALVVYEDNSTSQFILLEGTSENVIYSSPFSEWSVSWINDVDALLIPKASGGIVTSAYILNTNTKSLKKIHGPAEGLLGTVSSDKEYFFFSKTEGSSIESFVKNLSTGKVTELDIATLPEKCAWQTSSILICTVPNSLERRVTYPDDWYKGKTSFIDDIYSIDMSSLRTENITSVFDSSDKLFDAIDVQIGEIEDGYFLHFINKKDLTLWGLKLD